MKEHVRRWALAARKRLEPFGTTVTGARWYRATQGQRKRDSLFVCLEGMTANANFFGATYRNRRRGRLIELAYEINSAMPGGPIPAEELILDIRLTLNAASHQGLPLAVSDEVTGGVVDVTVDHDVQFVSIEDLLNRGQVQIETVLDDYCLRYQLPHVLMHGRHYISPDRASVELLETLMDISPVRSVLEIGAGVGICGVAAQRRGIEDFTFVDISPRVCEYVQKLTGYRAFCADALSFVMNRPYDVVLLGLPYELNHDFMATQGTALAKFATTVIFQSGCRCFFDWEHDWLMDRSWAFEGWPWFRREQTLGHYFEHTTELSLDWQLAAVGSHDRDTFMKLVQLQDPPVRFWADEHLTL